MSTNRTQHYQLHAWGWGDEVPMSEFNENFTKLDAALKAEVTARSTGLAGKAGIVTGTYTGNGTKNRAITLGFAPTAVLVIPASGRLTATYCYYGGLGLTGAPVTVKDHEMFALTSTGFRVSHTTINHANYTEYVSANENNTVYHYLAVK